MVRVKCQVKTEDGRVINNVGEAGVSDRDRLRRPQPSEAAMQYICSTDTAEYILLLHVDRTLRRSRLQIFPRARIFTARVWPFWLVHSLYWYVVRLAERRPDTRHTRVRQLLALVLLLLFPHYFFAPSTGKRSSGGRLKRGMSHQIDVKIAHRTWWLCPSRRQLARRQR